MIAMDTILTTENYRLRIPNEADVDLPFSASRYPGFNDGMQWDPPAEKDVNFVSIKKSRKAWQEGNAYDFTIEGKEPPRLGIGRISISKGERPELWQVGYWTHPAHQGKGVMTEALGCILTFGFLTLEAKAIEAQCATWNKASEKVLLKNGFKFIAHLAQGFKKQGKWVSENAFVLRREDWEAV